MFQAVPALAFARRHIICRAIVLHLAAALYVEAGAFWFVQNLVNVGIVSRFNNLFKLIPHTRLSLRLDGFLCRPRVELLAVVIDFVSNAVCRISGRFRALFDYVLRTVRKRLED